PEALGAGGNCCVEAGYDPFWTPYVNTYGNLNLCTFSIENCDRALDNSTPCPQAQIDASFKLVLHLAQKYHIAPDHIKPHSSIDPLSRAHCPGNYPFADLIAYVQKGGIAMNIPQGWSDDGHTLNAPNGQSVVLDFRDYILNATSWDVGNQPLTAAYQTDRVLLSDASAGAGQVQLFRDTLLWQTSAQGVVQEPHLGLEIKAAYDALKVQPTIDVAKVITALRALQIDGVAAIDQILKDLNAQ
ncbi:MAG: N-acetylmuramoyl-L-alanine amidase, partial [Ktedonobacteraceae bacterium]